MGYKVQKHCRTCGKLYTPCASCENDNTAFHWRTVACCYECGMEYFKAVMKNREKDISNDVKTISEHVNETHSKQRIRYTKKRQVTGSKLKENCD